MQLKYKLKSKAIINLNIKSQFNIMQVKLDDWLGNISNESNNEDGNLILVIGDNETKLKYAYALAFISQTSDNDMVCKD
jgi:hypothetical protein